jgi:hypothetical protein
MNMLYCFPGIPRSVWQLDSGILGSAICGTNENDLLVINARHKKLVSRNSWADVDLI